MLELHYLADTEIHLNYVLKDFGEKLANYYFRGIELNILSILS